MPVTSSGAYLYSGVNNGGSMRPEVVIDADGHITEPELVWTEYTTEKYRDRVLQVRTEKAIARLR